MNILCIDIGNTHAHHGLLVNGHVLASGQVQTREIDSATAGIPAVLENLRHAVASAADSNGAAVDGVSFCSVVPAATARLLPVLATTGLPVWHLRHDACPGLGIHYPRPAEIGPDRLANCIGAQVLRGAPAVVIDMGTAVTFDILTDAGYEGGIIAPGLGVMTRYLHEQTALLPALDPDDLLVSTGIGKNTLDAMRLGCVVGFAGMIDALLSSVLQQPVWGAAAPAILATGGTAGALPKSWGARIGWDPALTLRGLEEVFRRGMA